MFVVFPDVPEGSLDAATQGLADLAVAEESHKRDEVDLVLNCPLAYFPAMMGDMAPSWTTRQKVLKDVLLPRYLLFRTRGRERERDKGLMLCDMSG